MLKRISVFIMRNIAATVVAVSQLTFMSSVYAENTLEHELLLCKQEVSALLRLDCYDKLLKPLDANGAIAEIERSELAVKALKLEQQRDQHTTDFLIVEAQGDISPEVIITTPALGVKPPRPVLVFSCLDNITRMQIVLLTPLPADNRLLTLKTNSGGSLTSHWFIRDNGYLLESSRGLPGISQIQKLFNAETLYIESENTMLNGLSFNIKNLSHEITPLRRACRW